MKHQHIFFDLDHTIWDFEKNSFDAFEIMFDVLSIASDLKVGFDIFHSQYMIHNQYYWDLYAKGGIKQDELKWKRMWETLKSFDLTDEAKAKEMSNVYLHHLPQCTHLFPFTREILAYLKNKKYQLHIVSNGFEVTQLSKLKYSKIEKYFTNVVTSERCGYIKPDARIFDITMYEAKAAKEKCIMIGDSPEADLKGALNAGIDSIYADHHGKHTDVQHTHRISHLQQLELIF